MPVLIYGGILELPQKVCGGYIKHGMAYAFVFEMPKIDRDFEVPHFSNLILRMRKWGNSRFSNAKKWGSSRKKHVIDLKTRKEPKMNIFDFGAFQKQMHMPSRAKYLLHILFGAFQETSRTQFYLNFRCSNQKRVRKNRLNLQ